MNEIKAYANSKAKFREVKYKTVNEERAAKALEIKAKNDEKLKQV